MKKPARQKSIPAIHALEKELALKEALDPTGFHDLKQASLKQAVELGAEAETMKKLLGL